MYDDYGTSNLVPALANAVNLPCWMKSYGCCSLIADQARMNETNESMRHADTYSNFVSFFDSRLLPRARHVYQTRSR